MFQKIQKFTVMLYYSIDWGWNPTHTESALRAVELFLNSKKSYPRITKMFDENPELKKEFESEEFSGDMSNQWDLNKLRKEYPVGTLGYEYADFMTRLGFHQLDFNLEPHVPKVVQNIFRLGVKNHDIVHLLFGLYDDVDGKLGIRDFHEYVFLSWVIESAKKEIENVDVSIAKFLLLPARIKSFLTLESSEFHQALKLGKELSKTSHNLNQIWLKKDFGMSVAQVREKYGVRTLGEIRKSI
jgi:ubiquinone biosynthesis protein Coq4